MRHLSTQVPVTGAPSAPFCLPLVLFITVLWVLASGATAQVPVQEAQITASDFGSADLFGGAVAFSADGQRAIVGAVNGDSTTTNDDNTGAVYVFQRDGVTGAWNEEAKLTAADAGPGDAFGGAVDLSSDGQRAIVGAVNGDSTATNDDNVGAAYVFRRDSITGVWTQEAKLLASDFSSTSGDSFGISVALSANGQACIVGSRPFGLISIGGAYVYQRDNAGSWTEEVKLTPSSVSLPSGFGGAVALSNDGQTALVGNAIGGAGAAFVFQRSGSGAWSEESMLTASASLGADEFGTSVALSADAQRALIGAPRWGNGPFIFPFSFGQGAAYVFQRDAAGTWSEETRLTAMDGGLGDEFGTSVAFSADGQRALVGAPGWDGALAAVANSGAAYVFDRDGTGIWLEQSTLTAADAAGGDAFGNSVAFSADGQRAIIGARFWNDTPPSPINVGAAYVFDFAVSVAPPAITDPPADVVACEGDPTVTFTVTATGMNLTYQWRVAGGSDIAGATGSTLTLISVGLPDVAQYECVVSNSGGSVTSSPASLTIVTPPVLAGPTPLDVCEGDTASFSVAVASGGEVHAPSGTTPATLTYSWDLDGGASLGSMATLSLSNLAAADAGTYTVTVQDSGGICPAANASATLTVRTLSAAMIVPSAPNQVCVGTALTLTETTATGQIFPGGAAATLNYAWSKDGTPIAGASSAALNLGAVGPSDAGTYTVTVTHGSCTQTASYIVLIDSIAPVPDAMMLADVTGECMAGITAAPTATDNCDGSVTGTTTDPLSYTTQGTHVVTWTFTDSAGNASMQTQDVVITDVTPPTLGPCPADIEVRAAFAGCAQAASWTPPTFSDNCAGAVLTSTHSPGDLFFDGVTLVTYTVTDAGGQSVSCSFNVTVIADFEAPDIYAVQPSGAMAPGQPEGLALVDVGTSPTDHTPDGNLDLVSTLRATDELSILYNDGTGHYVDVEIVALSLTGVEPIAIAIGDFDGMGGDDLAVSLRGAAAVQLVLNDGGNLAPGPVIPLPGQFPAGIVVGDLDGGGQRNDIAVAMEGIDAPLDGVVANTGGVALVLNADGVTGGVATALMKNTAFRRPRALALCERPTLTGVTRDLVIAEFGDGTGAQNVLLYTNDGLGDFTEAGAGLHLDLPTAPIDVVCGDLDADGIRDDLAVAVRHQGGATPGEVFVFLNTHANPGGLDATSFAPGGVRPTTRLPFSLATGDLRDNSVHPGLLCREDVLTVFNEADLFGQLLDYDCTVPDFLAEAECATGSQPRTLRLGDVNGDGLPDMVVTHGGDDTVQVHLSKAFAFTQPFGQGCPGTNGLPVIGLQGSAVHGGAATVTLAQARPNSGALLGIAASSGLQSLGTGCNIYLGSPVLVQILSTDALGTSSFSFSIPAAPAFSAADLYFQWVIFDDAGAFQGQIALSDALHLRIGL